MRSANQVNFVLSVELFNYVPTKQVAGTSGADGPTNCIVRIRPHKVTHSAIVRHFLLAVDGANLVKRVDRWAKATMHAEDLVVDDGRQSQVVEYVCAVAPHVDTAELAQAFVIEAVHLCDLAGLVVAANQSNALWITHLQSNQKQEGLDGVAATVDEITHEEVISVRTFAAHLKKLLEVVELAVDVTTDLTDSQIIGTYCDGTLHVLYVAFLLEDLSGAIAKRLDLSFLNRLTALQLLNPLIEVMNGRAVVSCV